MKPLLVLGALYLAYRAYASSVAAPATGSAHPATGSTGAGTPTGSGSGTPAGTGTGTHTGGGTPAGGATIPVTYPIVIPRVTTANATIPDDATILAAVSGNTTAQQVVNNAGLFMGWDQWNAYYSAATGYVFPPAAMDTVPFDRWGEVSLTMYLNWAIPASSGLSLNGMGYVSVADSGAAWLM